MIESVIKFSLRQKFLVIFLTVCLIAFGIIGLVQLPIDAVPDITNVQVQVLTSAPALSPLDIEKQVSSPIEIGLSGLPGVRQIRSTSKFGLSVVTVVFDDSTDIFFDRQLVLERLSQIRDHIPPTIPAPQLGPISTGLGEIFQYELKSADSKNDQMALRTLQDWELRKQLVTVPGVAEVNSYGGLKKQFQVKLDADKLLKYGLSLQDILKAVTSNNENAGGGYIEHQGEQYVLRGIGLAENTEQIGKIVVRTGKDGTPVFVKDIGEVVCASELRQGAVLTDGKGETVAGIVMMLKGQNSRVVIDNVKRKIAQVNRTLPPGVKVVPFYDRSELIDRTIQTVQSNLTEGATLVVLVLLLLLGNWRAAVLVASVIPLSMFFAALCMNAFNISGNLVSLGALDFGLIVDGAVVMVENAVTKLSLAKRNGSDEDPQVTIEKSCLEVGRPVAFAVTIITIVYLPLLALGGIEGKLFKPMCMTIIFALIGALILSLTYIPVLLSIVLPGSVSQKESPLEKILQNFYRRIMQVVNLNRSQTISVAAALLILSLITVPMLGSEFVPKLDEGALAIQMQQLPSVSLTQSIASTKAAEQIIKSYPEVDRVISKIGRAEVATDPMGVDTADIYVRLESSAKWAQRDSREAFIEAMSRKLQAEVPQAAFSFSQPIELRTAELIAGVKSDLAIKIFGDDLETLKSLASKIKNTIETIPGAEDVKIEQTDGLPQLLVIPDRDAIARRGMNVVEVNDVVQALVAGKPAGQIYQGEKRFDLILKIANNEKLDDESLKNVFVATKNDMQVPFASVASIKLQAGPSQISHEDGRRRIVVELNIRGRDLGSFVADAQNKIGQELKLPPGYSLSWGGQFENMNSAIQSLAIVLPVVLSLIFVLLYMSFGSCRQALLIFTGIPFALVGGIFALAIQPMPFSISAGVGLIALCGVALLNGVVMVSHINLLRKKYCAEEAAMRGAVSRLRPVLMTALVASLGFVPMAMSNLSGSEIQRPLATVIIGGLISSSILTLILLPILYVYFDRLITPLQGEKSNHPAMTEQKIHRVAESAQN